MPDVALRITSYFRDVGEVPNSLLKPLDSAKKNKALREGTLPVLLVLRSMRGEADTASDNQQALLVARRTRLSAETGHSVFRRWLSDI